MININDTLFRSIAFSVCALFLLLTAIFLLIYKIKNNTERKKLYYSMLIFTFVVITLEIIISFTIMNKDSYPLLNNILCRIYLFFVFLWPVIFMIYMFSYKKEYLNKIFKIFAISVVISSALICTLLPLEFSTSGVYTIKGPLVIIMNIYCLLISLFEVILLLTKKVVVRNLSALPLFMGTALYLFIVFYQIITGNYFNAIAFMYTLIVIDLFYSSESQDYQLLEDFSSSKIQSEELNKNKEKFLSNMSKEIRTPMSNIIGISDLILMNNSNTVESIQKDGKEIYQESINLLAIINNILDLARFEANKESLSENDYNLDDFIVDINTYVVNKYKITPVYKFADNTPNNLFGDSSKLKKIIQLLMDNELKGNNIDSINVEYKYTSKDDSSISFDIVLTFMYKSTAKNTKEDELKLEESIVNFCSEILNAKIEKNDSFDFGIEYKISITQGITGPNIIENINEKLSSSLKNEENALADYSNFKVLVVDDSQININIVKRLFSKYKLNMDEALSGEACIDLVSKNKYDIIFLDDMMPGLSGSETLVELKTKYTNIPPVIALTANSYDGLREKYIEEGFKDYLSKPIEAQKMNKVLETYLNNGGGNNAL